MDFSYQAKNQSGDILEGKIDAPSAEVAVDVLHGKGYVVLSLKPLKTTLFSTDISSFFSRTNTKDLVMFTRQLSTLVEADMPLNESLKTLAAQTEKAAFRKVIGEISELVESGTPLSGALSNFPKQFSTFYINLVQSGEVSGKLQESLAYLADYVERSSGLTSKLRGALAYPAFILTAMLIVAVIMAVWVLPNLLGIFKEYEITELPFSTKALIAIVGFVNKYLYFLAAGLAAGAYSLWRYVRTEKGREIFDNLKIKFPSLGTVVKNFYLARMAESLSTLIKSGIPILDGLQITADLVGNRTYQKIMLNAKQNVREGSTISEALQRYKEVPPLFTSMVAIGEKTGKIAYLLEHITKFYKSESENAIQNISQLIEPILILVLGFGVAVLVASILLPMYSLVGVN